MKQENIQQKGLVLEALGNSMFKVKLDSTGQDIICTISGKIRKNYIRIVAGDEVELDMSPYDLTKGRITKRVTNPEKIVDNNSINTKNNRKK